MQTQAVWYRLNGDGWKRCKVLFEKAFTDISEKKKSKDIDKN